MIGGGFVCPSCRTPLGIDLGFIIENPVCQCPSCEAIMSFDYNDKIAQEYKRALKEIEDIKKSIKL